MLQSCIQPVEATILVSFADGVPSPPDVPEQQPGGAELRRPIIRLFLDDESKTLAPFSGSSIRLDRASNTEARY